MIVPVTNCGLTVAWRFVGSPRLDACLDNRPWAEAGGVVVIRVDNRSTAQQLRPLIEGQIETVGQGHLRIRYLDVALKSESTVANLSVAICRSLGLSASDGSVEPKRQVANALHVEHAMVVFVYAIDAFGSSVVGQAEALCDFCAKQPEGGTLTLIVFDNSPSGSECCDFSCGQPEEIIAARMTGERPLLWAAYLHTRVAWEAAGELSMAMAYGLHIDKASISSDDAVELCLNQMAQEAWCEMRPEYRATMVRATEKLALRQGFSDQTTEGAALLPLWSPPGRIQMVPKPWAARAMLLNEPISGPCKPLLRHCLVCQPLAQVLLAICFQLEAVERANLESINPGLSTSEQSIRSFDEFVNGNKNSPKRFYPNPHPAKPDGPIQFESFGGLLHYFRQAGGNPPERLFIMSRIRNSLAHGHYPSWAMLNDVRDLLRSR